MPQPYERTTDDFSARSGAHRLSSGEAEALLLLAKHAARDNDDRRAAPLVCYLAGQVVAGETDAEERSARIRALAEQLAQSGEAAAP